MWTSILQRHFPRSSWKKHYSKIIFFSLSVFQGLKPSFLWDIGPTVTATQISSFVKEFKSVLNNTDRVLVTRIDADIFITNVTHCSNWLNFPHRQFIEIGKDSFRLMGHNEDIQQMIGVLEEKFQKCDDCEIWELNPTEIVCPPCLFGLLLNYPLVYFFDRDYPPFSVELKVYEVFCRFKVDNVAGRFQVFAFSVPQSLLNPDIDNTVSLWFDSLQFPRQDFFSDLSLESSCREVDTLVLCGLLKEAAHYFRECLVVNPRCVRAAHNLESVSNLAVERWHFRMLNDQHRNEAFREAIIKKIKQGFDRVLDVGTGTGMLSLFAAEGKAKQIYACDSSPIMIEIAQQVFTSNQAPNIKLLHKHSSQLQIPGDIHSKVPLLVTETFDAALLGEDILDTLSHAWQELLLPPNPHPGVLNPTQFGIVIPFGASVYLTGIELDAFANDFHLKREGSLFQNCNIVRNAENYDTHDLSRARYRCLTGTEKIFQISFNDPNKIADISKAKFQLDLRCTCPGRLDCFAVWFDLCVDEDIVLSTSPLSRMNSAWDQAIFPLPRSTVVEENQDVPVIVTCDNKKLNVTCGFVNQAPLEVSEDVVKTLNNGKLAEVVSQVVSELSVSVRDAVTVLEYSSFPVFGVGFVVQRREKFRDELVCFVPSEGDVRVVSRIAEIYGVEVCVLVQTETEFEDCLQGRKFDVIYLDVIEANGEMKDGVLLQLEYLKSLLKPGGLILPEQVVVIGQFIHSEWLWRTSKVVDDSVTCGFNIAEYINTYQVRHFIDLDLKSIEKTACSQPFELFSVLDPVESISERTVPRCSSAVCANAMVYWFKIKLTGTCEEILTIDESCYRQAAILFPKTELPEEIRFNVIRSDGLFSIELLNS